MPSQSALKLEDRTFPISFYLSTGTAILPAYTTPHGALFAADCMAVLPHIWDGVIDTVLQTRRSTWEKNTAKTATTSSPTRTISTGA